MKIVVTGAGGFLGRALIARLLGPEPPLKLERLVLTDLKLPETPARKDVRLVEADLRSPEARAEVLADGVDVLISLAALPSGASEGQPRLARELNLDASIELFEAAASSGRKPRIVHASSIAALGQPRGEAVDDTTPLRPTLTYGALKGMLELWLCDMARRGSVEALALRLPGLTARPLTRTGQASAFLSDIFHHMREGRPFTIPVSPEGRSWLMSIDCCAWNMLHAATLSAATLPDWPALTLPALHVRIGDLVEELAAQTGADPGIVRYEPDERLQAIFASYPPLRTPGADALGLKHDGSIKALVANVLADLDRPGR